MKIRALALLLVGLIPTFAADNSAKNGSPLFDGGGTVKPAPMYFEGPTTDEAQMKAWKTLIKYKVYGEEGISFIGQNIFMPDSIGWFGTSNGDFLLKNNRHIVGGPIVIGGSILFTDGDGEDSLTTGPVRATGSMSAENRNPINIIKGPVCVNGNVNDKILNETLNGKPTIPQENRFIGGGYSNCPEHVPDVDKNLTLPLLKRTEFSGKKLKELVANESQHAYIDVPPMSDGDERVYDVYVSKIELVNGGFLIVRMPKGGRLTRVFVEDFQEVHAHSSIRITYMDSDSPNDFDFDKGQWRENVKPDPNGNAWHGYRANKGELGYEGNLLFYSMGDILFMAMDPADTVQGTFISASKIKIKQHMSLAGQILADSVVIDADFDGEFVYAPFDNVEIDVEGSIRSKEYEENDSLVVIPLELTETTETDVYVEYCFDWQENHEKQPLDVNDVVADGNDLNLKDVDAAWQKMPICHDMQWCKKRDENKACVDNVYIKGGTRRVKIPHGYKFAQDDADKIWINVYKDGIVEAPKEYLYLNVIQIQGAVLPGGKKSGQIALTLIDKDNEPNKDPEFGCKDGNDGCKGPFEVEENSPNGTVIFDKFEVKDPNLKDLPNLEVELTGKATKDALAKELFEVELEAFNKGDVARTLKIKVKDNAKLDYEALYDEALKGASFDVVLKLKDGHDGEATTERTIKVIDVNEKPSIADTSATISENAKNGSEVVAMSATDPDKYSTDESGFKKLTYSIIEKTPFEMKGNKVVVRDSTLLDYETKPEWKFKVVVADGGKPSLTDTADVVVTLKDENENPEIVCKDGDGKCNGPFKVKENSKTGFVIFDRFEAKDQDANDLPTLTVDLAGKDTKDALAKDLFKVELDAFNKGDKARTLKILVKDSAKLDYEKVNPSYNVVITLKDGKGGIDTVERKIEVIDVNETPIIENASFVIKDDKKNGFEIGQLKASDPDIKDLNYKGKITAYEIVTKESIPFKLNGNKVLVADSATIVAAVAANKGEYTWKFDVRVTDGGDDAKGGNKLSATATVTVKVSHEPRKPEITCVDGVEKCDGEFHVKENTDLKKYSPTGTVINSFKATDYESIADAKVSMEDVNKTGADSLFKVNLKEVKGVSRQIDIVVADESKLDYEKIEKTHVIKIKLTNKAGLTDSITCTIIVDDVNETPTIEKASFVIKDDKKNGFEIGQLKADDPDKKDPNYKGKITAYDIVNKDGIPFKLNGNKVLVADSAAIVAKVVANKGEYTWTFKVRVTDGGDDAKGGNKLSAEATVTVKVSHEPRKPQITCLDGVEKCDGEFHVKEYTDLKKDSPTGTVINSFKATDYESIADAKVSMEDVNKTGADSLFKVNLKEVKGVSRQIDIVVADESKLDYEKIEKTHVIKIKLTNKAGLTDSITCTIIVDDVNENPVIRDTSFTISDSSSNDFMVGLLTVRDPDVKETKYKGAIIAYEILTKDVPFKLDGNKVLVADSAAIAAKQDYTWKFQVRVWDGGDNEKGENKLSATATVTVIVKHKARIPEITCVDGEAENDCKGPFHVEENTAGNTIIHSFKATDYEDIATAKVSLGDVKMTGVDSLFDVVLQKSTDGLTRRIDLIVREGAKLDFEKVKEEHQVSITLTNKAGLSSSILRTIIVDDVNEKPFIADTTAHVTEKAPNGTEVVALRSSDPDSKNVEFRHLTYEILTKNVPFAMDSNKIVVTDSSKLVYKDQPKWKLKVLVTDGYEKSEVRLSDTAEVEIIVDERFNPPHIFCVKGDDKCPGPFSVDENTETNYVIHKFEVTDEKFIKTVTASLKDLDNTGADSLFKVVMDPVSDGAARTMKIVVKDQNKLDYEKIGGVYKLRITVMNDKGLTDFIDRVVEVKDVNETPNIEDQTFTVSEFALVGITVGTAVAMDPDTNSAYNQLTFSKVEGSEWFDVLKNGEIKLLKELDYETDSVHVIKVRVTDGTNSDTAKVTIKVLNEIEPSLVEIIEVVTEDSTVWRYPDTVYTNTPGITFTWNECVKDMEHCNQKTGDTTVVPGVNKIVRTFQDSETDVAGTDEVVVIYSNEAPIVEISTNKETVVAKNIYSIVEKVDANDSNVYVNHTQNDIRVKIVDPLTQMDTTFTVDIDLGTKIDVPKNTLKELGAVIDEGVALNDKPGKVAHTPVNGNGTKVSYNDKVSGVNVTVSYMTDKDGEVQKQDVIGAKGKKVATEVFTVSYETEINGKKVTVSYEADAATGDPIYVDANGHKTFSSEKSSLYTVSYNADKDSQMQISYNIDKNGKIVANANGDKGYNVSYTFVNKCGNAAKQDLFVVLDQIGPDVEILTPTDHKVVFGNFVDIKWTVDGAEQDSLTVQSLDRGANVIVRFYQDKAGNISADTVYVIMKNAKDVDINVEKPVTIINSDSVEKYYEINAPVKDERYAVSIYNPKTDKEVETLIGFRSKKNKKGSGDEPYAGLDGHLGPTLGVEVKMPMANAVGGLATLDDIIGEDGMIAIEGVDAANSKKMTVDEYAHEYCTEEFVDDMGSDLSKMNLFDTKLNVKIWVYTNMGLFVDYYTFTQELNDPELVSEGGLLNMYFEQKPDKDGYVRTANGKDYATGAYVYKTEVTMNSTLRCTLPPVKDVSNTQVKGAKRKATDELLKSFGYKRPEKKK
ncbi:MAG: cadherin repeat domain-containing protein [Fibrobacter sp.]|nr:cadherin repeat domain-containing protein [Fibrobacter sp.]